MWKTFLELDTIMNKDLSLLNGHFFPLSSKCLIYDEPISITAKFTALQTTLITLIQRTLLSSR